MDGQIPEMVTQSVSVKRTKREKTKRAPRESPFTKLMGSLFDDKDDKLE
jgi:hypothetical protein